VPSREHRAPREGRAVDEDCEVPEQEREPWAGEDEGEEIPIEFPLTPAAVLAGGPERAAER
jgi:hypothetical protein